MAGITHFCCGLSLKHGTIIIGVVQSILAFMFLILSAAYADNPHELIDISDPSIVPDTTTLRTILICVAVASALQCIFSILLIFSAETNRPNLCIPWLILNPLIIATYIISIFIAFFHHTPINNTAFIFGHLTMTTLLAVMAVYKFMAVHSFYRHLKSLNF